MKKIVFILLFAAVYTLSAQTRTDSIHVARYDINLSIIDFTNRTIEGYTQLDVVSKVNNLSEVRLDFITSFTLDSIVTDDGTHLSFVFQDDMLYITLSSNLNIDDTTKLFVYYQGVPFVNSWGGFTYSQGYAFNIGVALSDVPHSYGRVWFPCIDDFMDKSIYSFSIRTEKNKRAICNGLLTDSTCLADSTICWRWQLRDPIPAYLASVAVGEYELYKDTFHSVTSTVVPLEIYAPQAYINNIPASFINLKTVLRYFENSFTSYPRERIGYVLVDFNGGAMEHSTNIAYPMSFVNGTNMHENYYIHEVSHEWFGNLITCQKAEEMWINEGFASYCALMRNEVLYADPNPLLDGYTQAVRALHYNILTNAHIADGDYYALNNVPLDKTYGSTSYDKGALIVHVLRNYLGDSLFFKGMKSILTHYAFKNIGSEEFFNHLSQATNTDMTGFYEAYINQPGFLHFSIDSIAKSTGANQYKVHVRQRLHHAIRFADDNRIDLTFFCRNKHTYTVEKAQFSGETGVINVTIPFEPQFGIVDLYEKLADAIVDTNLWISNTGRITCLNAYFTPDVQSVEDTVFMRVEHNLVKPDGLKTNNPLIYRISDNHYWRIEYTDNAPIEGKLLFRYDIRNSKSHDYQLLQGYSPAKDLVLLYRKNAGEDWRAVPTNHLASGLAGYLETTCMLSGEYVFALGDPSVSIVDAAIINDIIVYPNPNDGHFYLSVNNKEISRFCVFDMFGKRLLTGEINTTTIPLDMKEYAAGMYFIRFYDRKKQRSVVKIIKQ